MMQQCFLVEKEQLLKANVVDMTVLINKEKGEVVKIVDLRPWK